MIWTCKCPLPPRHLSPNNSVGQIGQRMAKADAEKKYKALCVPIFAQCPVRKAYFVRVSMSWYCVGTEKAQPNKKGVITKGAKMDLAYMPMDVQNAWGAAKHLIDAIVEAGIVCSDSYKHMAGGNCDVHRTDQCRTLGVNEAHIKVELYIEEDLTLL